MKKVILFVLVLLVLTTFVSADETKNGGGVGCIACTIGMKLLQDIARKEGNMRRAVEVVCGLLPPQFQVACKLFMAGFAGVIIREFERGATPDRVCRTITFCSDIKCNMFTPTKESQELLPESESTRLQKLKEKLVPNEEWWRKFLKFIGLGKLIKVFETHIPFSDSDDDMFATGYGLRGTAWRGKGKKKQGLTPRL
jgi:hypothetical protein